MITLFLVVALFSFGQERDSLCVVSSEEYDSFPASFDTSVKVFQFYVGNIIEGNEKKLNVPQKVLCYYFICEGMIDNSGFYSILLESFGEYNDYYAVALELIGDQESLDVWSELVLIFELYKESFLKQIVPPELDDESEMYDESIAERIELLEIKWYALSEKRKGLFESYQSENKSKIIRK